MLRKRIQGVIILIILFIAEIGLSYLFVYDLAWFFGIISPKLITFLTMLSIGASFALTSLFILHRVRKGKQVLYGFKEFSDKRATMITILLVSLLLIPFIFYTTIDLNDAYRIELNNAEDLRFYNSTTSDYIIHMYSDNKNVTSDEDTSVYFWFNSSILSNVTQVAFLYFNGTHSQEGEFNKTQPITEYPERQWWTGQTWFYSDDFGNGSIRSGEFYRGYTIPAQVANTTVLYRLAFRMENSTGFYYTTYFERNFTVQFSPSENEFNTDLTQIAHFYSAVMGLALLANIGLMKSFYIQDIDNMDCKRKAKRLGILSKREDDESYPTVRELISISEKLEATTNRLRIMSGVLMTLSTSTFIYISSVTTIRTIFDITMISLVLAIICCLFCLVLSLGRIEIQDETYSLTESMIPTTDSITEFRFLVYLKIIKQEEKINRMNQLLQGGILVISGGLIIDVLMMFLRPWDILLAYWFTSILLLTSIGLVITAGALYVLLMAKSIGYLHGILELKETP